MFKNQCLQLTVKEDKKAGPALNTGRDHRPSPYRSPLPLSVSSRRMVTDPVGFPGYFTTLQPKLHAQVLTMRSNGPGRREDFIRKDSLFPLFQKISRLTSCSSVVHRKG